MKSDAISARILEDARAQAAQLLQDARSRADAAKADCDRRIEERRVQLNNQVESDIRQQRSRMLRMAELEQKKAQLGAKREVIEQVFETVLAALRSMPADQRGAYNKKLLLTSAMGGEQIVCAREDEALFDDAFLEGVNAELAVAGKVPVTLSADRRATGGGFILKAGGCEVNCTYGAVLEQSVPQMEADVARMLFGSDVK